MNFYQSIAEYYEKIFPLNRMQIDFVRKTFKDTNNLSLLDIGCGTGSLAIELSKVFDEVTAIDLDATMIEKASGKYAPKVDFKTMNMLNIHEEFGQETFDAVLCFGNTLVHLDTPIQILDFFIQSRNILKEKGKLLFQIINYDTIIEAGMKGLQTIENDSISFVRNYTYHSENNSLDFETILSTKKNEQQIKNTIKLYPLRKSEIEELLKKAGFKKWRFYANFKRNEFTKNSIPLVVEADK